MEVPVADFAHQPKVHCIYAPSTQTWCYIVADRYSGHAVIIDPLISKNEDGAIATAAPDAILAIVHANNYTIDHILETNAAEKESYSSATWYLRTQLLESHGKAPRIAVRKSLKIVQRLYARKYGIRYKFWAGEFDGRFIDGEVLSAGGLQIRVIHLPGRSTDHVGYLIGNNVFTGDCCFHTLRESDYSSLVQECLRMSRERLLSLPPSLRISTTRGCPAKVQEKGCVGEPREEHVEKNHMPNTGIAGRLDDGLVT